MKILQQELYSVGKGSSGLDGGVGDLDEGGDEGEVGEEDEGDDADETATNVDGDSGVAGTGRPGLTSTASTSSLPPTTANPSSSKKSKVPSRQNGTLSKKMKEQMLKAVAYFALPNGSQLMRLDPEYQTLVLSPSSFRLDTRGRFAAVVWSERLLCVYDIYTLLILSVLHKPQVRVQGGAAPPTADHVIQLSIFGAFPCRALPNAAGIEYNFGPLCFHPSTESLMLTVLRHKRVPRSASTSTVSDTIRMPLSPVIYAVSLRVHHAVLSAIGCYDLGEDVCITNGVTGSAVQRFGSELECSINWRPISVDCTPFTGLIAIGFQTTSVLSCPNDSKVKEDVIIKDKGVCIDDAPAVEDISIDTPSGRWKNAVASDNPTAFSTSGATQHNPNRATRTYQKTSAIFHIYSLDLFWLRETGLSFLTAPIFSPLLIAPDCFTHGEGVLSRRAVYAVKSDATNCSSSLSAQKSSICATEFKLVDQNSAAVAPTDEMSDSFPILLMLRPALDGANGMMTQV